MLLCDKSIASDRHLKYISWLIKPLRIGNLSLIRLSRLKKTISNLTYILFGHWYIFKILSVMINFLELYLDQK